MVYRRQGPEDAGWVTDDFIHAAARSIPGLDVDKLLADRDAPFVADAIARAEEQARAAGVNRTPSFQIGRTGGKLELMQCSKLKPGPFKDAVEEQLRR